MAIADDVRAQIERNVDWADSSINDANTFLDHLNDITRFRSLNYASPVSFNGVNFNIAEIKDTFNKTFTAPSVPAFTGTYQRGTIYQPSPITIPALAASPPQVNLPVAPSNNLPATPVNPYVLNGVTLPVKPNAILPVVPTIKQINIPTAPVITLPTFKGTLPDLTLVAPDANFTYNEVPYSSALLAKLTTFLSTKLDGGTGLTASVEQQIWDRARNREAKASEAGLIASLESMAAQGFDAPTGAMQQRVIDAQEKLNEKSAELSREIAIEQAKLEQENDKTYSAMVVQLEGLLIQHADRAADRALEVAKARVDLAIRVFDMNVAQFNANITRYQAEAQVFQQLVQAALTNAEIYRIQVESAKLEVDVQSVYVDLYRAQLQGVDALLGIYRTEMDAANIGMQVERNKIDAYGANISAYQALVQSKVAEFGMYSAQVDGEKAKVDVFSRQVQAFTSEVEAQKAVASIEESKVRASVEAERSNIDSYRAGIDAYTAELRSVDTNIRAGLSSFEADLKAYDSGIRAKIANSEILLKEADINLQEEIKRVDFSITDAIETTKRYQVEAQMDIGAAKYGAGLYANMASNAVSGINSIIQTGAQDVANV